MIPPNGDDRGAIGGAVGSLKMLGFQQASNESFGSFPKTSGIVTIDEVSPLQSPGPTSYVDSSAPANEAQLEPSRFPLMDFTQESLQALVSEFLARHDGLTEGDIEDIYPCSPVQEAVLASQHQGRSDYVIRGTLEVMSLGDGPVQLGRLEDAWKSVVRQSPILRTVFLEDTTGRGLFCQVVVRSIAASIDKVQCSSLNSFLDRVGWTKDSFSPHCLTFWEAPAGKTYLKLELNHAISDGVATLVIVHELMRLYDDPSLRLTGPSYRDFMTHLRDVPYEEHLDYWRDFLSGAELSNFTRLSDPTPSGSEPKIGRREMKLDRNRIRAVGGDKGVTLTMFFQAVWAVILRSYLHSNDVLFGFVSSGRRCVPLKAVGTALGPYIAQMVARAQIQNSDTLVELAKKLHHSTTEALSHEQCSLARIQRELRFNGSMFNTMVDVQRHPPLHKTGKAIYMAIADVYSPTEYDIVLNVEDRGTELAAKINYSTDFFTAADAEVLESVFLSTVEQFLRDPEQRVMDLDLAPRHHQDRIMSWNSTLPKPVDECIPNLIDIEAARFPEAPAIRSLDMDMTFQELADATNRLARHLVWLGVSPGDMIPFCMEKSPWAIIAMLAIMKAGAAFVPLDPANPPSRSAGIVADTNASIILTSPTIQPAVTAFSEQAIIVVVDDSILETSQSNSELPSLRPDYVAYVLFTSGSTGKPKGVVVPHRSICSSMRGHGPGMGTVRGARVLQFAAFTFDAMVYEVFTVLATGGCVCVPSDQDRLDDTVSAINQLDVNLLMLTPTFLRTIDPSSVPGVETVILIGEAAGKDVVDAWCDRVKLYNGYGPTETCVVCVAREFSRELGMTHDIIGKAVGCRSWVVDLEDHNKLAPLGAVGELLIEGPGVSKGYLNDAEKTAASFIEPPSWLAGLGLGSPDAHAAFYKTGDVVRQLYDGSLKFCGRVDDQVKVNGQRLELGEVETHLTASGLVLQSLAYVPKSGPVSGRLVALISLRKTTGIAPQPKASKDILQLPSEGLRDEVAQEIAVLSESIQSSLPAYMVPSIWIPVLSMPMQQSGKLDRKTICSAVLNMDDATFQKISSFQSIGVDQELDQAFAGKLVESRLRDIWSEVLNTPKSNIGLHRPFLALGGDSISAMRVVSRARTEGIRLGVADILRHSTIAEISRRAVQIIALPGIRPLEQEEPLQIPFSLSPIQAAHFNACPDGENRFSQSIMLQMKNPAEVSTLRRAIDAIVDHHPMLRARFSRNDDHVWTQSISQEKNWRFVETSLDSESIASAQPLLEKSQNSLDFANRRTLSVDVINLPLGRQFIYIVIHHLVVDLVSWRIIFEDLEDILKLGKIQHDKSLTFRQWRQLQQEYASRLSLDKVIQRDPVPADLGYWDIDSSGTYGDVASVSFKLDEKTTSLLLGAANESLRTQPVELFMAAVLYSFANVFTDRAIPSLFTESHGRHPLAEECDIERTIGWFTTISPITIDTTEGKDLADLIRLVKDARRTVPNEGLDYFTSRWLTPGGKSAFAPHDTPEIIFNYQGLYQQLERSDSLLRRVPQTDIQLPPDVAGSYPRMSLFDILSSIEDGQFLCSFTWPRGISRLESINRWVDECKQALVRIANSPLPSLATLSEYPLIPHGYAPLDSFVGKFLEQWKLNSLEEIETILPCSPIQEGIIASQVKDSNLGLYDFESVWKVSSETGTPVNLDQFESALREVVGRHQILRTVFCESEFARMPFVQVVLRDAESICRTVFRVACNSVNDIDTAVTHPGLLVPGQFPYSFTIYETAQGVYCKSNMNHALVDGASMAVLLRDIYLAYDRLELPPAPLYGDFIAYLQNRDDEESYAFWKSMLEDVDPCHFPSLNKTQRAEFRSVDVPVADGVRLREFCRSQNVTMATLMSTVWSLVLQSYLGKDTSTVCFGFLAAGRDVPVAGVQDIMGPLFAMLVQMVSLDPSTAVTDLLGQVQNKIAESLSHQHCSLSRIQNSIGLNGTKLFNTVLNLQRRDRLQNRPSIKIESEAVYDPSEFDISFNIVDADDGVSANLQFWTSCLSEEHALNVSRAIDQAIRAVLENPAKSVGSLSLFHEHHATQLRQWNSSVPASIISCVHRMVEEQVDDQPGALAVCTTAAGGNIRLTYRELDDLAAKLASHLASLGVGPGTFVPFCHEKSPWTIVVMYAILKAGGACVALDPSHPPRRLQEIINMTEAKVVVSQKKHAEKFDGLAKVVEIAPGTWDSLPPLPFRGSATPRDAAFVTFTSGSTGVPKGIVLEHASLCTSIRHHGSVELVQKSTRALQFGAYTFDVSVEEIFTTLSFGGCVCVPSEHERLNDLSAAIKEMEVNWAHLTPTVAGLLNPVELSCLETIVLGGEAIPYNTIAQWLGHTRVIATYGPAECSITCSGVEVHEPDGGLMGLPAGANLWIVAPQDHNKLVPIGSPGEILIEGPLLARGYMDEKQTEAAFIYDPAWAKDFPIPGVPETGRRMYKSGDMARFNLDGSISSAGRKDMQVKIHGQRVDLREIEHHIAKTGATRHAAALILQKGHLAGRLVLVFSLLDAATENDDVGAELDLGPLILQRNDVSFRHTSELRSLLEERVPGYMLPRAWICVNALPVTANGKLDRKQTQRWLETLSDETYEKIMAAESTGSSAAEPDNPVEKELRKAWSRVLGVPEKQIGTNQSFFNLAGDSISAIQVSSILRNAGIQISVQDILQFRSIQEIAKHTSMVHKSLTNAVWEDSIDSSFPLSPIQRMHFNAMPAGQNHYNQSFLLRFKRSVQASAVHRALEAIVKRHSMLRTRFHCDNDGGQWSQTVTDNVSSLHFTQATDASTLEDGKTFFNKLETNLDIRDGPVLAAGFLCSSDGAQHLFLVAHHLVVDIVSWRVIIEDLQDILQSRTPSPSTMPFQAWVHSQIAYAQNESTRGSLSPAKVLLFGVPPADFEFWGVRDVGTHNDTIFSSFDLGKDHTARLVEHSSQHLGSELVDILLAAVFQSFRHVFPDRRLPSIFNEGHGREPFSESVDISRTVGWFTTMYPIAIENNASALPSFPETLRAVRDARRFLPGKGWPYFTARYLTADGAKQFADHEKMEILFNYLGQTLRSENDDAIFEQAANPADVWDVSRSSARAALFDIVASLENGQLKFHYAYSSKLLGQDRIQRWVRECESCLTSVPDLFKTHATVLPAFGDFPLLRGLVDYSGLETITRNSLSELKENISQIDEIDDIYPCSPMQEGILASRARQQGLYDTQETWKVTPRVKSSPVDLHRLQKAVCMVISRHPLLRTYFVEGTALLPYVQVVLKKVPNPVDIVACKDLAELLALSSYSKDVAEKMFTYRFTIAETPKGEVFCKLEMNHALIDGISMKILVRDIVLAYDSPDTPTAGPLYSEFIRYLQQKQPEETAIAYWANLLGDVDPCLFPSLAVDSPEAPKVFNARDLFLSSAHVKRVHEFCQNNSTTVANFMSAVWALVLQAYTGSSTVCFGYLSSGRDAPVTDADAIVGPLINMMIRKVDLDGQLPVPELIETMHTNFLQGFSHQHCSLAKVHHALDRERRRGQLFNTVVNVQRLASPGSDQSAIEFEVVHGHDPSEYDITFNVVDSDREIFFSLQYWTSCLSDEHAELLRSTLLRAVESLIDNAAGTLASIDLFSDHHKAKVLEWNSNVPQTVASCIHELVERRVQSQPNAQAVSSSSTVLTYKELDDLASKLAGHLALLGVGPETMVPFYFEKSAWGVVTTYAILKAGGACVALSPEYPRNRVASIIESTRATIAVADATLAPRLADLVDKVVVIDASKGGLASMKEQLEDLPISQPVRASPENPCFITFTSGSTGTPKGIVIEHASLCTSIHHHGTVELLAATSRVLQFASYIFDVSVEEMFTTLSFGGCVCVPTEQERMNDLATFIQSQNIDWAHLTPTVASLLDPEMVPGLKTLVLGGELIPKNIVEKWVNRTQLIATYGPAECSITCTGAPISPSQVRGGQMGLPAGALIWIADPKDPNKLAPIGCPGEIMIEGPLLARGYLDPVQTAAAFLVDLRWTQDVPANGVPSTGRRVYKAGDMARYSLDGSIISGGRKDTQVKIRGQRVDLREIEHHLEGEDVRHAAALIPSTGYWKEKIIAVFSLWDLPVGKKPENLQVMAAKEIVPYINKFRSALQDNVPGYMMPAAWIAVETLPLTTNGKMNRRQVQGWLETMDPELCKTVLSLERRGDASGPRRELNEMEKELVTIWAAVLDIEESRIGLDQAFFSLGGDSISAMQVTSRLRAAGIRLPVHDILRYRTIAALATRATYTEERQTSVAAQTMTNRVESIDTDFGLTPIQQMHFQIHKSGQNHYNQSILIKLRERSNANVVHEALLALVARHPMLRARFRVNSQGVWAQRITTETSESCRFTSFSASSLEESIPMLSRSQTSLDIINGPLMAADLVQTDEQQYLYIVIHHLAIDLVSWGIIFREMEALLSGKLDSPQPLSFQTWALAQADYALENLAPRGVLPSGGLIKPDFEYWNMTDTQNAYGSSTGATFSIDRESTRLILGDANTAMHTEPVEIILAVIITSFQRIFRDRNVPPVFLEGHGRESWLEDIDISKTIGWFTTMYPIQVSGAKTVAAPTHDNQLTDLERILREVKDVRRRVPGNGFNYFASRYLNPDGIETFQGQERMEILFNYLGGQQGTDLGSGLFGKSAFKFPDLFDVDPSAPRAALFEISAGVEDGELRYSINYSSNIGRQDQIRAWIRECELLLASACKKLAKAPVIPTLVDYPLLQLDDYEPLDSIVEDCVVRLGLPGAENIESIHPCSPMQEGILFSRSRTDSLYDVQVLLQVTSRGGQVVDLHRFQQACEQLIAHHQALRTHFIEAAGEQENLRSFLQVVEKHVTNPPILLCKYDSLDQFSASSPPATHETGKLPYRFTICEVPSRDARPGEIYLRIEINHALIDGTSTGILVRDLMRSFDGELRGLVGPAYSDFIAYLQAQPPNEAIDFWTAYLSGVTKCQFPVLVDEVKPGTDKTASENAGQTHPAVAGSRLHVLDLDITKEQSEQLHSFCKSYNTTLANLMSAVWAIVLQCFVGTSSEDPSVCFGYLNSGRDIPIEGVHDLIGPLITILARRAQVYPSMRVIDLVEKMQDDFARSLPHQHCSLAKIHHALGLGASPLFNTTVNLQKKDRGLGGLTQGSIVLEEVMGYDPSEYDISLGILDGDHVQLSLTYWDHCLSEVHARSLSRSVSATLASILSDPNRRIADINLVSAHDLALYHTWNADSEYEVSGYIHNAIKRQVDLQPEAPAICSTEPAVTVSYRDLDRLSDHLAKSPPLHDIEAGAFVLLCFDKSPWTPLVMLAVLKAGGACVAVDPSLSADHLEGIIEDTKSSVVLATPFHAHLFATKVAHVIEIDGEKLTSQLQAQGAEGRYESADDGVPLHPKLGGVDRPAFVIFNSSGTEKPEGVVVNHSTYCTSVAAHAPILRMQRGTRVLQFASYMEDTSAREIYTTLMVGGCVCVPSESQLRDQLAASIQAMHVNYLSLTPTVAAALQPTSVPTVQTLVVSGEVINRGVLASWADSVSLITTYGPAGTAGWTTANVGIKSTAYPANLGQTKLGNSLWITDPRDSNKLLPIGALGEIVVGGPAFAHRYLSTEPKADSAFVEPPAWYNLSKRSNGIEFFYRSGDLGRYNPDGSVTLVGRKSDRSGQLDNLEQVCQQLVALPGIEHAAVLLPQSGVLGRRLVAVLSLRDVSLNLQQPEALRPVESRFHELAFKSLGPVRSEAELVLPMQKVPTEWIVVEKIPLLSSGRLDTPAVRTWLEKMTQEEYQTAIAVLAHGNSIDTLGETNLSPLEIELRSVFAQVLKQDSDTLSTSRTFIGLGGDSISAMQVVWHARARGINIFVQDVMRMGSISKIAVRAAEAGPIPGKGSRQKSSGDPFALLQVPTSRLETLLRELTLSQRGLVAHTKDIEDIFPCSPVQEGILISQAKSPSQYKVRAMWKVTTSHPGETVVVDRLVEAWNKAAARHQALRSFFIEEGFGNASFAQVVLKEAAVPVLQLDYDTLEDFMAAQQADTYPDGNLPYQVTIGRLSSGDVYCKLVISHALDDGFSRQVVLRDVAAAYDNTLSTEKAPAYSDYIAYISRQPAEAASTYWKNYLSDVSPCHFPVLNQEVQGQSLELPIVRRVIDQEQTAALQLLCVEQEVTISDVFKVIWAVVLRAYLGGEPVAFGYLTSGRDAPIDNVHGIAGPLINMLVYRTEGNAGATFADLLKEAHNDYAQSLPHQYAPLKEVLHVAGAGQDGLFNTVVNVMSLKFQGEAWNSKIAFEPRPVYDPTEYSVSLDVVESKSEIELFLDYWPSYLSPEQAAGIIETVLKAIGCLLDNPSQTLGQLDLFSKRDQLQVSRWGAIPDYGDSECLHHVIERRAAAQPDAPAVASDDGGLSYKELNEFANVLAHHLVDLGAGLEKFIPLCFEKSPWGVVAMVAVLKAGAACVGLDPAQPLERMETIISDTNASLVLASTANAGRLKNRDVEVVLVNSSTLASLPRRATAPKTAVTVDNAAYIVYTSGSTGTPKGAILEHRNLYAMSLSLPKLGMTAHSRVGHFASYAFDVSIEETILTLMQGACSCVISDEDRLGDLAGAMNRLQVTWSELTPTVVRMLEPRDLPHLETLIVGGEVLPDDIIAKWSSQVSLVNTYGPCECSITCSMTDVLGTGTRGVNIGGPLMANFWITDIHNSERLVPVGAIGELVIEGPLVGRGYLNNKEKTRESFLQNPAWSHDSGLGHRFYKTGDLARWNLDGTVTYLGRKDSQAKIHGQRIELTEIEHHICDSPLAKDAIAVVPRQGPLAQRLVSLVVVKGDFASKQAEDGLPIIENAEQRSWAWDQLANIRQIVEIKLPRHMVPTLWIPVIRLPLLASGKTNRRLIARWLEEMHHGTHVQMIGPSQEQEAIVPPSTEMEIILRDLWAELLHTAPGSIGIDQNFFGIGGDSVLAMRLISLLRSRGVGVTAGDIFQKKTIAKIALGCRRRLVDHNRAETAGGALANDAGARNNLGKMRFRGPEGIVAAGIEDSYPCSPMQESILEAQEQNKNGWYSQWIYELGSPHTGRPVDLNNVADAWQKTVARHQILRTLFFRPPTLLGEKPERYQQIVLKSFEAPVVYINADAEDPATIFEMAPDIPSANVPPHRVILASTPSGKTFAQFQLSHTLYDAVSLSVLWHDLQLLYTSDAGTELPRAPPYRAFIDYLEGAGRSEAESFWRGRLARLEPCNFPVIAPLSSRSSSSSAFKSLAVPFTAGSNVLRSFCRTKGITTGNLFQAAWALVLRHFTGRDDLCFGYMLSGRDAPIEDAGYMLGPFINLMPCRVDLSPTRSLASVLSTLQEGLADILTNQNCSLEDITAAIGAATPLYNTFLNMQRVAAQEALQETALTMKELGGFMADEYAISVYVVEHGEEVSISMNYWTHVLSEEQAAQVARAVDAALSLIFERSGKTLGGCRLNLELEGL